MGEILFNFSEILKQDATSSIIKSTNNISECDVTEGNVSITTLSMMSYSEERKSEKQEAAVLAQIRDDKDMNQIYENRKLGENKKKKHEVASDD